jgi:hypothetical protein
MSSHQKGEKVIAIVDNNGYILAALPIAPVNEADTVLLPEGLKALKRIGKQSGLSFKGAYINLDGGFDSASHRKAIFNTGFIPNVKENQRNRKRPKRGRKRLFNQAIHGIEWNGCLHGKTNSSGCYCALSTCNVGTTP